MVIILTMVMVMVNVMGARKRVMLDALRELYVGTVMILATKPRDSP